MKTLTKDSGNSPFLPFLAKLMTSMAIALAVTIGLTMLFSHGEINSNPIVNHLLPILVFALLTKLSYESLLSMASRNFAPAVIFSLAFSTCLVLGHNICQFNTARLDVWLTWIAIVLIMPFITCVTHKLFDMIAFFNLRRASSHKMTFRHKPFLFFFAMWAIMLLSWFPYFLAYFPGAWTFDCTSQAKWLIAGDQFSAHHPPLHTLWLTMPMQISYNVCGSYVPGMIAHTISQMLLVSGSYAFISYRIFNWGTARPVAIGIYAFFCIFPGFAGYSVVLTKDVMFAAIFSLMVLVFAEIARKPGAWFSHAPVRKIILLSVVLLLGFMFRNNLIYGYLIFLPFCIACLRAARKHILVASLISISCFAIIVGPIYSLLEIEMPNIREALSVPAAQLALTMNEQEREMTGQQREFIEGVIPDWEKYDPRISDPVKNSLEAEGDPASFLGQYFQIGTHYPSEYLDAALRLSVGFWSPITDYGSDAIYMSQMQPWIPKNYLPKNHDPELVDEKGHLTIANQAIFSELLDMFDNADKNRYEANIPVLYQLFQAGTWIWMIIFGIFFSLFQRNKPMLVPGILALAYLLTVVFGPLSIFRYALPFYGAGLIAFALLFQTGKPSQQESGTMKNT